ncbi:MAG: HD domain-containing protein [bacterium]|nr:HD domain-containing protein [bacterium]
MDKELIEQNKTTFIMLAKDDIKREGIDALLAWLESSDFFTAPASTKFHLCEEGGLCAHSLNVYERMVRLCDAEYGEDGYNKESIAIIALFHDLCKTNIYKTEMRNVKENGEWVQKPFYTVDDSLPYGHGEKSVYMLSGFMKLTRDEAMAINWHMGGLDARSQGGSFDYSKAFTKYPLALLIHLADMQATFIDENVEE